MTTTTTTSPLTGAELAARILERIQAEPDRFDMGDWAAVGDYCGTTYCVAGWGVVENGGQPEFYDGDLDGAYRTADEAVMPDGRRVAIDVEAARLLGLNYDDTTPRYSEGDAWVFYTGKREALEWLRQYAATGKPPSRLAVARALETGRGA